MPLAWHEIDLYVGKGIPTGRDGTCGISHISAFGGGAVAHTDLSGSLLMYTF